MEIDTWIEQIIQSPIRYAIPIMTHPGIEMSGHTVSEAVQDGEIHAKAIKALSDKYPSKASTVIMDLTVEAEAFGCQISFPENDMPHISGRVVDGSNVEMLKIPPISAGRIPQYLKANKLAAEMIRDKAVLAGVIGPFSLAGRLFGMSEIMTSCYLETEAVELLLEKCTQFIITYSTALKNTGCDGLIIAEPAAGLLSNEDCLYFSSQYIKRVIDSVQDERFMVVLHNCGNTGHCTNAMLQTGARGYHFGNAANMSEALKQCPADVLVMGNVDPVAILKMMTPEEVKKQVLQLLEETADYPNFVLSTGCDVPPHVDPANIHAFYDALSLFNKKIKRP
ncbi:MAG: uroporphyrinogen decarboxylase family protein [Proteiniphilum sp.]